MPKKTSAHKALKTSHNILVAFILNLSFAFYEFIGGTLTGSIAIISDAIHDLGDALSIGIAYFLERKSHKQPDQRHTYGYLRYSLLGALITTAILLAGSILVIINAIERLFQPQPINYQGMIWLAIIGTIVNFIAAYITRHGDSLNQKSVNLHMLEDVLGWIVVLIGAIVMNFTDFSFIDSLLSIGVALFIFRSAFINCCEVLNILLENTPHDISPERLRTELLKLSGVEEIHHLHLWSMDGYNNYATLHVVTTSPSSTLKSTIKATLKAQKINHATIEFESPNEACTETECKIESPSTSTHNHHHRNHR